MGEEFAAGFVAISGEAGYVVDVLFHGAVVGDLVSVVIRDGAFWGVSFQGWDDGGDVFWCYNVFLVFLYL